MVNIWQPYSGYCLVHDHLSWPGRTTHVACLAARATQASAWPAGHAFCGPRKIKPSRRQFTRVTLIFSANPLAPSWATNSWKRNLKLHTNLEIFASNPILKTHFFELGKNVICKEVIFYGNYICSMKGYKFWPARFRGKSLKSCQRDPYKNGCRHLAENFQGKPQIFCIGYMGTVEP